MVAPHRQGQKRSLGRGLIWACPRGPQLSGLGPEPRAGSVQTQLWEAHVPGTVAIQLLCGYSDPEYVLPCAAGPGAPACASGTAGGGLGDSAPR